MPEVDPAVAVERDETAPSDPVAPQGSPGRAPEPGDRIGGYVVEERIGAGGMGVIYRAHDDDLDRSVALKIIAPFLAQEAAFRSRFLHEAQVAATIAHPNVVPVYRAREDPDGRLYIAMQHVDGPSLQGLIDRHGALPVSQVSALVQQIADALDAVHARGLVHRDVKPANVLIDGARADEHVYLTDFGLAVRPVSGLGRRTGTLSCLAPEQIRGRELGPWTDVYALGCLVFTAVTGEAPFAATDDDAVVVAHLMTPPPSACRRAPGLPPGVDAVLERALAKNPLARFASAGEMARALAEARFDVALSHHPDDERTAAVLRESLAREGVSVAPESARDAGDPLAASDACIVLIGRQGLGAWASDALTAAHALSARDRSFRMATVLVPGAPDPLDPSLAFLFAREWVDLREGLEDADPLRQLARLVRRREDWDALAELPATTCPFRGLEAFDEVHAEFFVGREMDVTRALERLEGGRFLAVLGPSGSGKSSLVRAGIVPAVRLRESVAVRIVTPGPHPLLALAAVLGAISADTLLHEATTLESLLAEARATEAADRALLVVDQFEEVFTLCTSEEERDAFLDAICYTATIPGGCTTVVLAMRADFYHRCSAHPHLRALVSARQHLVGPLDAPALRRAIEEPASRVGLRLAPGLTRRILSDVAGRPGALPHLQHLLLELWQRRQGRELTLEAYVATGGVEASVARRADRAIDDLPLPLREIARRVLLRLIQPGEGSEDTRRRAALSELHAEDHPDINVIVERLAAARLVITSEIAGVETIELSHEALIGGWPRMREWIDAERDALLAERRLAAAAFEWETGGRDDALLYRGARLASWEEREPISLPGLEAGFLDASRNLAHRDRRRTRRRRRIAVSITLSVVVALASITGVALRQRERATSAFDRADSQQLGNQASLLVGANPSEAIRTALAGLGRASTVEAEQGLRRGLAGPAPIAALALRSARGPTPASGMALAPDGTRIAVGESAGPVVVWRWRGGRAVTRIAPSGRESLPAFVSGGDLLATASGRGSGRVELWHASTGRPAEKLPRAEGDWISLAASSDGDTIAAGTRKGRLSLWSVQTRHAIRHTTLNAPAASLAFARGGRELLIGGTDGRIVRIDVGSGRRERLDARLPGEVRSLSVSREDRRLLAAGDNALRVIDLASGRETMSLPTAEDRMSGATFDTSGIVSADGQGHNGLRIRTLSGNVIAEPAGALNASRVEESRDGRWLVSLHQDGRALVWDRREDFPYVVDRPGHPDWLALDAAATRVLTIDEAGRLSRSTIRARQTRVYVPTPGPAWTARFGGAGDDLVIVGQDGRVSVHRSGRRTNVGNLFGNRPVEDAAMLDDDRFVLMISRDGHMGVRDLARDRWLRARRLPRPASVRGVSGVAVRPDGDAVAVAVQTPGFDRLFVWRWRREEPPTEITPALSAISDLSWSADGTTLALVTQDPDRQLWMRRGDGPGLQKVADLAGDFFSVAANGDGSLLALGGENGAMAIWSASGDWSTPIVSGAGGRIGAISFTDDGRGLVAADGDGTTLWRACGPCRSLDRVRSDAVGRVARDLMVAAG